MLDRCGVSTISTFFMWPLVQWVADLQVVPSHGQCGSRGCVSSSQCSNQSHLASSSTVISGGSAMLSCMDNEMASISDNSVLEDSMELFNGLVYDPCNILSGILNLFCHYVIINGFDQL